MLTTCPSFTTFHKPKGSPKLKYDGVKPTGPLPCVSRFPPSTSTRSLRSFQALFLGDTQTRDDKEVGYLAHDVIEELCR